MASNEIGLTFELKIFYHLLVWNPYYGSLHSAKFILFIFKGKVCWLFNKNVYSNTFIFDCPKSPVNAFSSE